jgi:GT2 family glycosyltransferase
VTDAVAFGIVIPTYNAEHHLAKLVKSIKCQDGAAYSIAVVDQSSTDDTVELAHSLGCSVIQVSRPIAYSPPGKSRNLGAQLIQGEILLHLDADMELETTDFLSKLARLFDAEHEAVIIEEHDIGYGFWSQCKALERRCYRGTAMESARAVTRNLFEAVGGYSEAIASGEDFFITSLYRARTEVIRTDSIALRHNLGHSTLRNLLQKKYSYGRSSKPYLQSARSAGTSSAASLVQHSIQAYLRNWALIKSQPVAYLAIFPLRAMEFVAILLGMWLAPTDRASNPPVQSQK